MNSRLETNRFSIGVVTAMRMLFLLAFAVLGTGCQTTGGAVDASLPAGEQVLALTRGDSPAPSRELVIARVKSVFEHLQIPLENRNRYTFMNDARLIVADDYFEANELSNALIVARKSVKISHASNVAVIAGDQIIAYHPRLTRAYEIRAWAGLLLGRGERAYRDAFSSLVEAPEWTAASFAGEKAAYRALAGYFALRQAGSREKATEWLQRWKGLLAKDAWPDAMALHFLGTTDERDAIAVAEKLREQDRGNAQAEAAMFAALEFHFARQFDAYEKRMSNFRDIRYSAGHTLAWVIKSRLEKNQVER